MFFCVFAELSVQIVGEHTEGAEIEIHDVLSQVEHVLMSDDSLGNRISRVRPDSVEVATFLQGERPIIAGTVRVNIHYFEPIVEEDQGRDIQSGGMNLNLERRHGF